jgi:hypothetical protein
MTHVPTLFRVLFRVCSYSKPLFIYVFLVFPVITCKRVDKSEKGHSYRGELRKRVGTRGNWEQIGDQPAISPPRVTGFALSQRGDIAIEAPVEPNQPSRAHPLQWDRWYSGIHLRENEGSK